ncbi:MAG: hypothetical protein JSV58_01800 [Candidatus Bathyarchaeota archaeon]|nr:MAG: hypothetical protein JSV58_01800 [Candidatus Bathyarchaeota archaeon]
MPRKRKEEDTTEDPNAQTVSVKQEPAAPREPQTERDIERLQDSLRRLKVKKGIIGYILRAEKSASIDINDPTKIIDYAVLSSIVLNAGEILSSSFELGGVYKVTLEGEKAKMLTLRTNNHSLSVFMENTLDSDKIHRELDVS